jgi:hypothetical protein
VARSRLDVDRVSERGESSAKAPDPQDPRPRRDVLGHLGQRRPVQALPHREVWLGRAATSGSGLESLLNGGRFEERFLVFG